MTKIFVYGTLLRGFGNWSWALQDQTFIGAAETKPEYFMVSLGGFPGVCEGGTVAIKGEVFEVTDERMVDINRLEGYNPSAPKDGMYDKELITLADGSDAYIYTYNDPGKRERIESGSWRQHTGKHLQNHA